MFRITLLALFPASIYAGNIALELNQHQGESFYTVESHDSQLKSKLEFPFDFNSLDIAYETKLIVFKVKFYSSFLLKSDSIKGRDYDWKENQLTVVSNSDNQIEDYYALGLSVSKKIYQNLTLFNQVNYKHLKMFWSNTHQTDFVQGKDLFLASRNLEYEQNFFEYAIGLDYQQSIAENILLKVKPSFFYVRGKMIDNHLLRGFYTTQNLQSLNYGVAVETLYQLNESSQINLLLSHKAFSDENVNMDYYNQQNVKYLTLPSSYSHKSSSIGIGYSVDF